MRKSLILAAVAAACGTAVLASAPLSGLARLQPGLWQLRQLDDPRAGVRSICIANPDVLIQLEHPGVACSRVVVTNDASGVDVQYTCPAGGYGRTLIRPESSRLAQIDSQGIRDNRPFLNRFEARWVKSCAR
ncbi:MAG TPA: hypothetical protein VNT25_07620 [Allosphingosinicella sp.]|nr:hypothetical protein [Allosphingosinicella sp.]